jgi:mRNA interferase MazF
VRRGEIWWALLDEPARTGEPGYRRPVLVIQRDDFNSVAELASVIVAVVTSNLARAQVPGNVAVGRRASKLSRDSVVNVTQLLTVNRQRLLSRVATLPAATMRDVETGLRLVLALGDDG